MAKVQSNPPAQLITLEKARAAGQAHGEIAFTATASPEIFEESIKPAFTGWRSNLLRCCGDSDRIINRLTWIVRGRHGEPNG